MAAGELVEAAVLEPEHVERLVAAMEPAHRPLALVLAYGGRRPGEAAAIERRHPWETTWAVCSPNRAKQGPMVTSAVGDTKTHRRRLVPLGPSVAAELAAHLASRPDDPTVPIFVRPPR